MIFNLRLLFRNIGCAKQSEAHLSRLIPFPGVGSSYTGLMLQLLMLSHAEPKEK
jgi:hypothetical protein